ncbi:MAG: hypothetical protein K0S97_2390 [Chloroflexota bacterium]|jgi:hypothetical protein|nr:hypothetical protein [Chloroflexota bacterium]
MFRIRRFGVMKTATVVAVMYMVIVAVFVIPIALIGLLIAPSQGSQAGTTVVGIVIFGAVAILAYGLIGWIFTALAAAIYNVAAGWVGGIEVQVEAVAPPPGLPAWGTTTQPPSSAPPVPPAPPTSSV